MSTRTNPLAEGTAFMIVGSLVGAVGAYVFNVMGGRVLGAVAFAPISVLWTVFFIVATIALVPVEQQVTRGAASGLRMLTAPRLRPAFFAIAGSALVGVVFVIVTLERAFEGRWAFVPLAALTFVTFGVYGIAKGILAGHRRFVLYGWALILESVGRVALGAAFLLVAASSVSLAMAMALCTLTVLALRPWRFDHAEKSEGPLPGMNGSRFLGAYIAGSSASQFLLAGAPLGVLLLGGSPAMVSITFATFTLFRGPLTLIYSLQGRLLSGLVRMRESGEDDAVVGYLRRLVVAGGVLVVVGAGVGWLVGPAVVELLFGPEFRPPTEVAALAAGGVVAASVAQIVGQSLVAAGRTGALARAWGVGLTAGLIGLALVPAEPMLRVAAAFAIGEVVALAAMTRLALRVPAQATAASGR
jgi:O-antigen/teichoic acid export membrane protein